MELIKSYSKFAVATMQAGKLSKKTGNKYLVTPVLNGFVVALVAPPKPVVVKVAAPKVAYPWLAATLIQARSKGITAANFECVPTAKRLRVNTPDGKIWTWFTKVEYVNAVRNGLAEVQGTQCTAYTGSAVEFDEVSAAIAKAKSFVTAIEAVKKMADYTYAV